jgi:hypothetical protein
MCWSPKYFQIQLASAQAAPSSTSSATGNGADIACRTIEPAIIAATNKTTATRPPKNTRINLYLLLICFISTQDGETVAVFVKIVFNSSTNGFQIQGLRHNPLAPLRRDLSLARRRPILSFEAEGTA